MSSNPQEDFEAEWLAESGGLGELAVCVVFGPPLLLVAGACRGVRAIGGWARRWPAPATLGVLTNEQIDDRLRGT